MNNRVDTRFNITFIDWFLYIIPTTTSLFLLIFVSISINKMQCIDDLIFLHEVKNKLMKLIRLKMENNITTQQQQQQRENKIDSEMMNVA